MELSAAIVGCGPRGIEHGSVLRDVDGISLVGVCDLAASRRDLAAAELGVAAYSDAAELISAANPEIVVIATQPEGRASLIEPIAASDGVRAAASPMSRASGFSTTIAYAEVPVQPGRYRVEIDTGGLRDPRSLGVQVFFNGRRIRRSRLDLDSSRIAFMVKPSQFSHSDPQRLSLVAAPFRPAEVTASDETRELALPVSSVAFHRVEGRA